MPNPEPAFEYVVVRMFPELSLKCRLGELEVLTIWHWPWSPRGLASRIYKSTTTPCSMFIESAGTASDIRGWLPALGMRPLELVRAAAVIWVAHIYRRTCGSVGKFMFSFIF